MAFKEIEPEEEENYHEKYPRFENIGDHVEGNLYEWDKDGWGNKRIVLEVGEDEEGEPILQYLPTHTHLRRFYNRIHIGDYIRVELKKLIEKDNQEYPTRIYKLQVDPDRKVEYGDLDDEYYDE